MTAEHTTGTLRRHVRARWIFGALAVLLVLGSLLVTPSDKYQLEPGPVYPIKASGQFPAEHPGAPAEGTWNVLTVFANPLTLAGELALRVSGESETLHQASSKSQPGTTEEEQAHAESSRQLSLNVAMNTVTQNSGYLMLSNTAGTGVPEGSRLLSVNGDAPATGKVPAGRWLLVLPTGAFESRDVAKSKVTATSSSPRAHTDPVKPRPSGTDAVSTPAFDLDQVGGSSAGLVMTLAWIDLVTPGDLAAGKSIAATGTVAEDGSVLPVAGVQFKLIAAKAKGVDLVLVPDSYSGPIPDGLKVVRVQSVQKAVDELAR